VKIVCVCVLLAFFLAFTITTGVSNASGVVPKVKASSGIGSSSDIGWGGFITSINMAQSVLNELQSDGYTSLRYEALAPFFSSSSPDLINYAVLDYIVSTAVTMGITVVIDPIHNYPESTSYTLQSHFSQWVTQLVTVGKRYNNDPNVILECVNEYDLSDAPTKYQTIVNTLRSDGITLPLQFTYMWGSTGALIPPKDPFNDISIGHHVYADNDSDTSYMLPGETFLQYCIRVGIEAREKAMFTDPNNECWFGYALAHGTKVLCTEIGGSDAYSPVMTHYNVAFVIRTLQYAQMYGVGVDCFRVGQESNIQQYETLAEQWFKVPLFTA